MPNAEVNLGDIIHHELKSLPEGYVDLRRMTYGESVQRRAMMKLQLESSGRSKNFSGELALASVNMTVFDFARCVVDHNLEDSTGRKFNLGSESDLVKLDPRVGQEIEVELAKLNDFEDEEGN